VQRSLQNNRKDKGGKQLPNLSTKKGELRLGPKTRQHFDGKKDLETGGGHGFLHIHETRRGIGGGGLFNSEPGMANLTQNWKQMGKVTFGQRGTR